MMATSLHARYHDDDTNNSEAGAGGATMAQAVRNVNEGGCESDTNSDGVVSLNDSNLKTEEASGEDERNETIYLLNPIGSEDEGSNKRLLWIPMILLIGISMSILFLSWKSAPPPPELSLNDVTKHLQNLQDIADKHDGTRTITGKGFNASRDYVVETLRGFGMSPYLQHFPVQMLRHIRRPWLRDTSEKTSYLLGLDFLPLAMEGEGDVTAPVKVVPGYGCSKNDYTNDMEDHILLVKRGHCHFHEKAFNALAAGAFGLLIYNDGITGGRMGLFRGTIQESISIPVFAVTNMIGLNLRARVLAGSAAPVELNMFAHSFGSPYYVSNVIVDIPALYRPSRRATVTPADTNRNVIVVGAHLDSVSRGPGINDNGSGVATLLETARQLWTYQTTVPPRYRFKNPIRLAWWGAEEEGLLGSKSYVLSLTAQERKRIGMNINLDMMSSMNYRLGVHNASSSFVRRVHTGSTIIQRALQSAFQRHHDQADLIPFNGRSDYNPFVKIGIPAGGIDTGAEGKKSEKEFQMFGGSAGEPYDPCYHKRCDNIDNVNLKALRKTSKAALATVFHFGRLDNLWKKLNP